MTEYMRHPDQPVSTDIKLVDGVFVKATTFKSAGMIVPQHAHEYAHLSIIASGAVRVEAEGLAPREAVAGECIVIPARVKHLFTTLQSNTVVMCVHNSDRMEAGEVLLHGEHVLPIKEG